jgi:hypothetical protein
VNTDSHDLHLYLRKNTNTKHQHSAFQNLNTGDCYLKISYQCTGNFSSTEFLSKRIPWKSLLLRELDNRTVEKRPIPVYYAAVIDQIVHLSRHAKLRPNLKKKLRSIATKNRHTSLSGHPFNSVPKPNIFMRSHSISPKKSHTNTRTYAKQRSQ